jgi:hypothetical protein
MPWWQGPTIVPYSQFLITLHLNILHWKDLFFLFNISTCPTHHTLRIYCHSFQLWCNSDSDTVHKYHLLHALWQFSYWQTKIPLNVSGDLELDTYFSTISVTIQCDIQTDNVVRISDKSRHSIHYSVIHTFISGRFKANRAKGDHQRSRPKGKQTVARYLHLRHRGCIRKRCKTYDITFNVLEDTETHDQPFQEVSQWDLMCLRRYKGESYRKIKLVECAGMFRCGYLTKFAVCDCINSLISSFYKRPTVILRHCATSRKAVGWIPDDVIGIFHWLNPSGRTMSMGLTQPLTEMSTYQKYFLENKDGRCVGLTNWSP